MIRKQLLGSFSGTKEEDLERTWRSLSQQPSWEHRPQLDFLWDPHSKWETLLACSGESFQHEDNICLYVIRSNVLVEQTCNWLWYGRKLHSGFSVFRNVSWWDYSQKQLPDSWRWNCAWFSLLFFNVFVISTMLTILQHKHMQHSLQLLLLFQLYFSNKQLDQLWPPDNRTTSRRDAL